MKLFPRDDVTVVDDPEFGRFTVGDDGAFDLPEALGERLHHTHVGGKKLWEDVTERFDRETAEDLERRRDPANLLAAVEGLGAAQRQLTAAELREAEEERKRIKAEQEAEAEQDRLRAAQRAEEERLERERLTAESDAKRIADAEADAIRLAAAHQAAAEEAATEAGIEIDTEVRLVDSETVGKVTAILSANGVPSAQVDFGDTGGTFPLEQLVPPAIVTTEDGTEIGDGKTVATLPAEAEAPAAAPEKAAPKKAAPRPPKSATPAK